MASAIGWLPAAKATLVAIPRSHPSKSLDIMQCIDSAASAKEGGEVGWDWARAESLFYAKAAEPAELLWIVPRGFDVQVRARWQGRLGKTIDLPMQS